MIEEEEPLLAAEGLRKHYGGTQALSGASLQVDTGEVHGLVGENGSGKSTLLKILAGQVLPDRADIRLAGEALPLGNPLRSLSAGIATVTQETTLVPDLSVAENILLGRRIVRGRFGIDWAATRARAQKVLDRLGLGVDPRSVVRELRPDERQMVEIARAISMEATVLILDEPTSSLTDEEVEGLFGAVRGLRDQSVSTIFVSHRMREVMELSDRVTVLRDGVTVATREASELDSRELIELMVGGEVENLSTGDHGSAPANGSGEARLRLREMTVGDAVHGVSLDVAPGEIVGLAGLVGAGRSELMESMFGLRPRTAGSFELDGRTLNCRGPIQAMREGLAYVPADRKLQGLILDMSTGKNVVMSRTADRLRLSRPPRRKESEEVQQALETFNVKGVASDRDPVSSLSGGNQQKVVLAKWLSTEPKAVLLDEPTRGVDVGAKAEIYRLLERSRRDGLSMMISSSETQELQRLCDRIVVMFRGRAVANLSREDATEARIAHYATGHE